MKKGIGDYIKAQAQVLDNQSRVRSIHGLIPPLFKVLTSQSLDISLQVMPRAKRTLAQVVLEDAQYEHDQTTDQQVTETGTDAHVAETSQRPKRARKQTQKYTSTPAPTSQKRAPRKTTTRATGKGKAKATVNTEELELNSGGKEFTDEPPKKKAKSKKESPATSKDEKRLAQFRSHCPQTTWERAERVRQQR